MKIILIDFGASRIKGVLYNVVSKEIISSISLDSPSTTNYNSYPAYTIPLLLYRQVFEKIIQKLDTYLEPIPIICCFEMHGFSIKDQYVSWKDSRANLDDAEQFFEETGMKLKPGIAYAVLKSDYTDILEIGTLGNAIVDHSYGNHISLLASQGFINKKGQISYKNKGNKIIGPITDGKIGFSFVNGKLYEIYGGIGDLQAVLIASQLGTKTDIVVNIGTGSQVAKIAKNQFGELRPINSNLWAEVITHIPAGRALNQIAKLVGEERFWNLWENITVQRLVAANTEQVNLNIFSSSWKYNANNKHITLLENQSIEDFVINVAAFWANQYIEAINILDLDKQLTRVTLTGGLVHKSKFLLDYYKQMDSIRIYSNLNLTTEEETLDGLINLSEEYFK